MLWSNIKSRKICNMKIFWNPSSKRNARELSYFIDEAVNAA